ncbi:MAG: sensor histidine kinase [Bacteroidota bacterium]
MALGIFIMLSLALAFVFFFNRSQRKILREQMLNQQLQLEHQEKLLHSTILTQEKERERIAKDLHDEIGSKLNVIHLNLHRLRKANSSAVPILETVEDMVGVVNDTIDTTRRISHDLLPPTLENFGLKEALIELCENLQKTNAIEVVFELCREEAPLKDQLVALNLYRVVQELVTNSIKYAEAQRVTIKLWLAKREVKLEYTDNGKGFDPNSKNNRKGLGLQNIESRMKMIGAKYNFNAAPGKGVVFSATKTD